MAIRLCQSNAVCRANNFAVVNNGIITFLVFAIPIAIFGAAVRENLFSFCRSADLERLETAALN